MWMIFSLAWSGIITDLSFRASVKTLVQSNTWDALPAWAEVLYHDPERISTDLCDLVPLVFLDPRGWILIILISLAPPPDQKSQSIHALEGLSFFTTLTAKRQLCPLNISSLIWDLWQTLGTQSITICCLVPSLVLTSLRTAPVGMTVFRPRPCHQKQDDPLVWVQCPVRGHKGNWGRKAVVVTLWCVVVDYCAHSPQAQISPVLLSAQLSGKKTSCVSRTGTLRFEKSHCMDLALKGMFA